LLPEYVQVVDADGLTAAALHSDTALDNSP
jgi:hypothetical protein